MRTYTHGVVGYLLYLRGTPRERAHAAVGGVLPDVVLAVGFVPHLLEPRMDSPVLTELHEVLHFGWAHTLTEVMHSFLFASLLFAVGHLLVRALVPIAVGMLAHGAADLLTHQVWPYNHFLPLPLEPLRSPLSYTSSWFTVLEHAALVVFIVWYIRRRKAGRGVASEGDGWPRS